MTFNLWLFFTASVALVTPLIIVAVITSYKTKMKQLEIEALNIQKATLKTEVENVVNEKLGDQLNRIEVLEAIVTDKSYELNEKITKLR